MTSKELEGSHITKINKILENSGIACEKVFEQSVEQESTVEVEETLSFIEIEIEESVTEENVEVEKFPSEETVEPSEPTIFPTPSLRKVLPENIRKVEKFNRYHVLPEKFNTKIDPNRIPIIRKTEPQKYIDIIADLIGCEEYKNNLAEYWVLDTLAYLLKRSQDDGLDSNAQAVLMLWFCEWIKEMQYFDAADRERMLKRFKDNMLSAAKYVGEECRLPSPEDVGISFNGEIEINKSTMKLSSSTQMIRLEGSDFNCSMWDLTQILHYIFDLFSTDYQFNLVRAVFCNSPQYTQIDAPHHIQAPKQLYVPEKPKGKKEKTPIKEKSGRIKGKKEDEQLEYLALMELKAAEERQLEEQEEREKEEQMQKNHILPLVMAANDEIFEQFWPTAHQESEGDVTAKSKKGKKK